MGAKHTSLVATVLTATATGSFTIRLCLKVAGVDGIDDGGELNGDEKLSATAIGVNVFGLCSAAIDSRVSKDDCMSIIRDSALIDERVTRREAGVKEEF
jgi:hypothetical protein